VIALTDGLEPDVAQSKPTRVTDRIEIRGHQHRMLCISHFLIYPMFGVPIIPLLHIVTVFCSSKKCPCPSQGSRKKTSRHWILLNTCNDILEHVSNRCFPETEEIGKQSNKNVKEKTKSLLRNPVYKHHQPHQPHRPSPYPILPELRKHMAVQAMLFSSQSEQRKGEIRVGSGRSAEGVPSLVGVGPPRGENKAPTRPCSPGEVQTALPIFVKYCGLQRGVAHVIM
jgi:hypothetical protein